MNKKAYINDIKNTRWIRFNENNPPMNWPNTLACLKNDAVYLGHFKNGLFYIDWSNQAVHDSEIKYYRYILTPGMK